MKAFGFLLVLKLPAPEIQVGHHGGTGGRWIPELPSAWEQFQNTKLQPNIKQTQTSEPPMGHIPKAAKIKQVLSAYSQSCSIPVAFP